MAVYPITLILSSLIQSASAWEPKMVNGYVVTWKKEVVSFELNSDNSPALSEDEVENAIVSASKQWDGKDVGAKTEFTYEGNSKKSGADMSDGVHLVSFDTTWNHDPSLLAVTHVWSDANNEIVHFDIEINADGIDWSTSGDPNKFDLHNTMTHEFGHALGLEHSDDAQASMASTTSVGEVSKRDIHEDDVQGFLSLYPENGEAPSSDEDSPEEQSSSSNSSGGGSVDNALIDAPNSSGGSVGPVNLEKAGCSSLGTNNWLYFGLVGMLLYRRQ